MKRGRKIAVATVVILGGLVAAAPMMASGYARTRIVAEANARGIPLSIERVTVGWSESTVHGACVAGLRDRPLACLDRVAVDLALTAAARGRLEGVTVRIDGGQIDLSAEMGTPDEIRELIESWRPTSESESGEEDREPRDRGNRDQATPNLELTQVRFDVRGQSEIPLDELRVDEASVVGGSTFDASMHFDGLALDDLVPGLAVPGTIRLSGEIGDVPTIRVEAETPLSWRAPQGVEASVSAVQVFGTRVGVAEDVKILLDGSDSPALVVSRLEVELRELTTDLNELFVARAELEGLQATVSLTEDGTPTFLVAPDGPEGAEDSPNADDDMDGADAPAEDPAEESLWTDRRWWEKIPQSITIRDGSVTIQRGDRQLTALGVDVDYAIRAVRPQLNLDVTMSLDHGELAAGEAVVHAEWNWATQALRLDLAIEDFALPSLDVLLPDLAPYDLAGVIDLDARIRERDDRSIADFSGSIDLEDFGISLALLSERLTIPRFSYEWDAAREPTEEMDALDFAVGDGRLGEAEFSFRPRFQRFNYHRSRLFETLDVRLSVPDQDANTLLASVPSGLLGDVASARMEGTWGYDVEFPITWGEEPEEGRRPINIHPSTHFEVRDDDLHLLELPETVDIRQLNGAFDFVFRGPDDSINRRVTVPPPRTPVGAVDEVPSDSDPRRGSSWARLDEVSYFLIAATLYREDGRFFRNRGINWYQWRAVLEQAWMTRELGRGASTVSMQLVKNVFLSHERSIERKLQELFLTYWMTRLVPKERILETYLNVIEWGPGINGVVEAAEHYFGKSPGDLSLEESVWLSSIVPAPVRRGAQRSQGVAADWSLRHCRDIIEGMHEREWITVSEAAKASTSEIHFVTSTDHPSERRTDAPPDPQDLRDLRLAPPASAPAPGAGRLGISPTERTRALIAGQLPLRP